MIIHSPSALESIRQVAIKTLYSREERNQSNRLQILCCGGTGCKASESAKIVENFRTSLKAHNLDHQVDVVVTGCFGFCEKGPIVKIIPDNTFYTSVRPDDVEEIVSSHIIGGRKVERLLYLDPGSGEHISDSKHMNFYRKQMRVALRNCGYIDPENIMEYIARGGYKALADSLLRDSADVLADIKASGLRGRGGAGFPTGVKWEIARKFDAPDKYVVCNADEGDPGAFMDRSIMEGDPNSVIEAMMICGYCINANHGLIYIRAEYPLAVHRLEVAISQAREYGLLGQNILGSGFDFDIEIRYGAGAFVCGEETALIHSMEGKRGEPTLKPPFPAESGYNGHPTNVNNVETLANVPVILTKGPEWFASIGTEKSKGTKVFALAGKINNVGLIEVPMGTTLREIIYDIGGGVKGGKKFKAVQTGGPSGGCLTEKHLDIPIDYESLAAAGSMMGSGGMIVMDDRSCMVDVARYYVNFLCGESCGKCTPCREGLKQMLAILTDICEGRGRMEDLDLLEELSETMIDCSLCALGKSAPNPVLTTLKYFRDEYEAHILEHRCPAGVCKALTTFRIDPEACRGCTACARGCPAGAISGTPKQPHSIDPDKCISCGSCRETCRFDAIRTEGRRTQ